MRSGLAVMMALASIAFACQYALDVRGRCTTDDDCLPEEHCQAERCVPGAPTTDGSVDLDGGGADGDVPDGSETDAGVPDGGEADSGTPDAGVPDAGHCSTCQELGYQCGSINDGCGNTVPCPSCTWPETCGGGSDPKACGCTPATCAAPRNCGTIPNGCGGQATCGSDGSCPASTPSCGGGGPNICGANPCTRYSTCAEAGVECGTASDNCGGVLTCPPCPNPKTCGSNKKCSCVPETDGDFCATHGPDCRSQSWTDKCGNPRSTTCTTCTAPNNTCNGSGTCVCVAQTNASFCASHGPDCRSQSWTDNCGNLRSTTCTICQAPTDTCRGDGACICVAQSDYSYCTNHGSDCRSSSWTDDCGSPRSTTCTICQAPTDACRGDGVCVCVPDADSSFCAAHGSDCRNQPWTDNCNNSRWTTCTTCRPPYDSCRSDGTCYCVPDNLCSTSPGYCLNWTDRCGGQHGPCAPCGPTQTCNQSTGNCDSGCVAEDFCGANPDYCYYWTDRCGDSHPYCTSCGLGPQVCSPVTRRCCTPIPETDAEFCLRACGIECGTYCSGTDNCGQSRFVDCQCAIVTDCFYGYCS